MPMVGLEPTMPLRTAGVTTCWDANFPTSAKEGTKLSKSAAWQNCHRPSLLDLLLSVDCLGFREREAAPAGLVQTTQIDKARLHGGFERPHRRIGARRLFCRVALAGCF